MRANPKRSKINILTNMNHPKYGVSMRTCSDHQKIIVMTTNTVIIHHQTISFIKTYAPILMRANPKHNKMNILTNMIQPKSAYIWCEHENMF